MNSARIILSTAISVMATLSFAAQAATYTSGFFACSTGPQGESSGAVVVVNGQQYVATLGTSGNDVLQGVDAVSYGSRDIIWGLAGGDQINGLNGDDIICGGAGIDTLNGGSGNDSMSGGLDNDLMNGGFGSDYLYGDAGNDELNGESDNDVDSIFISSGDKAGLYGGDGDDVLNGGPGDDWAAGQNGNDTIYGGSGNDQLGGGPNVDYIDGGKNTDKCEGETLKSCEKPLF